MGKYNRRTKFPIEKLKKVGDFFIYPEYKKVHNIRAMAKNRGIEIKTEKIDDSVKVTMVRKFYQDMVI